MVGPFRNQSFCDGLDISTWQGGERSLEGIKTSGKDLVPMDFEHELHFAAGNGDLARVQRLVAKGASMTEFDDLDWTPLHHAVREEQFEVVLFFLDQGVNVNIQNEDVAGETPLGVAVKNDGSYRMIKFLIDVGADPRLPGWMGLTAIDRAQERQGKDAKALLILLARAAGRLDRDD